MEVGYSWPRAFIAPSAVNIELDSGNVLLQIEMQQP